MADAAVVEVPALDADAELSPAAAAHRIAQLTIERDRARREVCDASSVIELLRRDTTRMLDVTRAAQRLRRVLAKEPRDPAAFTLAARELGQALDAYERDPGGHER